MGSVERGIRFRLRPPSTVNQFLASSSRAESLRRRRSNVKGSSKSTFRNQPKQRMYYRESQRAANRNKI